jgi:NADH:ubiquinone oxidoreductase subunit E
MMSGLKNSKSQLQVCTQMRYAPNPLSCANSGSHLILFALEEAVAANQLAIDVVAIRCLLKCDEGPNIRLIPEGMIWNRATLDTVSEIMVKCKKLIKNN